MPVTDKTTWRNLVARTVGVQIQQGWAYGEALAARGARVARLLLVEGGREVGFVQLIGRRPCRGPVLLWHGLGGPCWLRAGAEGDGAALRLLRRRYGWRRGAVLLLTPASPLPSLDHQRLQNAGFRQAMTGYTTAVLDLEHPLAALRRGLHGDWRRRLQRGPDAALALAWCHPWADPLGLEALLTADAAAARQRGYHGLPPALVRQLARHGDGLLALARAPDQPVAAMLFLRQGATALYQTGWSDAVGRRGFAHHHLLWGAIERLAADGCRQLDLGGLNVPAGIVRFKLASGATPRTFAGTFA